MVIQLISETREILFELSIKPTLSAQQFMESTEEMSSRLIALITAIQTLRADVSEDIIAIQQTTECNAQRNFDQILQNLSDGNNLQSTIAAQAQADAEAQQNWRSEFQISITEMKAEVKTSLETLEQVKQAQETHHMQNALQAISRINQVRPVYSRPVIRVV